MSKRLETGAVRCGDDWKGVFIRGDNALMGYLPHLERVLVAASKQAEETNDFGLGLSVATCKGLAKLLASADEHNGEEPQLVERVAPRAMDERK